MNFTKANEFKAELANRLFNTEIKAGNKESRVTYRFFGTSTPSGFHDFIPELTKGLKRYLIKGRPGTGKSTLMRYILQKAKDLGYDADVYYCSLDPKSLDMLIIPELNLCIFDATSPHVYEPSTPTDEIIDTYGKFVRSGTDERYADIIAAVEKKYNNQIKQGLKAMTDAHEKRAKLNDIYDDALLDSEFNLMVNILIEKL